MPVVPGPLPGPGSSHSWSGAAHIPCEGCAVHLCRQTGHGWAVPGSGAIAIGFGGGSCMWGNKLVDDNCLHRDLSFLSVSTCGLSSV